MIHPSIATKLGIQEGDSIDVESKEIKVQSGIAHISERVHPEVIASSQHELKKGVDFNSLTTAENNKMDFGSGAINACLRVTISKNPRGVEVGATLIGEGF